MKILVPVVGALGIPQVYWKGFEADDVIYSFAVKLIDDPDVEVLVYSMDADLLQLVRFDRIKIVQPTGKPLGRRYVESKFGIPPEHIQTLKAIAGDSSDGYKGVKGIGPVKAVALIKAFGGLFDIYAALDDGKIEGAVAAKLAAGRDDARVSWKLAALRLIVYNERRSPADRDRAMKLIFSNRIREGLDPEVFNALFVEG
jgi:DNA polymerase-1